VLQHVFARVRSHNLAETRTRRMQVREEELLRDSLFLRCSFRPRKVRASMFDQRRVTHVRNRARIAKRLTTTQRGQPKHWTFSQKQAGADRLTIGGSLSSNIHGRGLTRPPFIGDIESFKLVNATGQLLTCSRAQNPELFKLAIGGYGLFGFVYSVTLRLVPRQKLERVVEVRDIAGLMSAFAERVREGYVFGDFQYAIDDRSEDFLRRGVFTCYKPVPDDTPLTPVKREMMFSSLVVITRFSLRSLNAVLPSISISWMRTTLPSATT